MKDRIEYSEHNKKINKKNKEGMDLMLKKSPFKIVDYSKVEYYAVTYENGEHVLTLMNEAPKASLDGL